MCHALPVYMPERPGAGRLQARGRIQRRAGSREGDGEADRRRGKKKGERAQTATAGEGGVSPKEGRGTHFPSEMEVQAGTVGGWGTLWMQGANSLLMCGRGRCGLTP